MGKGCEGRGREGKGRTGMKCIRVFIAPSIRFRPASYNQSRYIFNGVIIFNNRVKRKKSNKGFSIAERSWVMSEFELVPQNGQILKISIYFQYFSNFFCVRNYSNSYSTHFAMQLVTTRAPKINQFTATKFRLPAGKVPSLPSPNSPAK